MKGFMLAIVYSICNFIPVRISRYIYKMIGIKIGTGSVISRYFYSENPKMISIGDNSLVNTGTHIFVGHGDAVVEIGNNVKIGFDSKIIAVTHMYNNRKCRAGTNFYKSVRIKDGAWLGAGVTILPGITIGYGCVIGAGSVVTRDTEDNCLYVGNPARKIKTLPIW